MTGPIEEPETGAAAASDGADPDDAKARFKAALERKRGGQASGSGGGPAGDSKIHGTHGAAGGKRTFRRKSG
jgi:hypothetical protein